MASGIIFIAHATLFSWRHSRRDVTEETLVVANEETHLNWFGRKITQHTRNHGGLVIFGFKIARLIGCLTLFSLSLATLFLGPIDSTHQELHYIWDWDRIFLVDNLPQIAMAITFVGIIIIIFHLTC